MNNSLKEIRLTQYSHGAGCGCKISPKVLDSILAHEGGKMAFPNLLVGNESRDDAAVLDLGDGTAIVSTTDFFMPVVDDPFDFGKIASVNAISDVYAMGASPILAIAILGWPVNLLPPEVAGSVMEGARSVCAEAGIPLAGGHSIDAPEPIFGLAVTGRLRLEYLKKNGGASPGDVLYLTKPLGVGILTTAQKKGKIRDGHEQLAINSMTTLNKIGEKFGKLSYVKAMTDVTGFGLLGHLSEMCEASELSAQIHFSDIPLLDKKLLDYYIGEKCLPGGTMRNFESYRHKIAPINDYQKALLCDPQTSGGLLVAVDANRTAEFEKEAAENGLSLKPIGVMTGKKAFCVTVV